MQPGDQVPDGSFRPFRSFLPAGARPELLLLSAGVLAVFFSCLFPSLRLRLFGDDFCFILVSRRAFSGDLALLFDISTYRDFFRPMLYLVYFASYQVFGLDALGYHVAQLAAHLAVTLVMYRIIVLAAGPTGRWSRTVAVLCALYFYSHFRLHQAVYWFSGIKQILSALCGLGAAWLVLKVINGGSRWMFLGALALGLVGLMIVESNIGFVVAAGAIILFWPREKEGVQVSRAFVLPTAGLVAAYLGVFALTRLNTREAHQVSVFWKPVPEMLSHLWLMFFRSTYPRFAGMDELMALNRTFVDLFPLWAALSLALAVLVLLKGWPRAAILLGLYIMQAAPYVILFAPVVEGDRIFYESVAALCLFAGYGAVRFIDRAGRSRNARGAVLAVALIVLIVLNVRGYRQVIPQYQRVDEWQARVTTLLHDYFMEQRPGQPVSLYWVGYPFSGESVLSTPWCIDKAFEIFFDKPVISRIKVGYYRVTRHSRPVLIANPDSVALEPDDLIIYDDGRTVRFMTDRTLGFMAEP